MITNADVCMHLTLALSNMKNTEPVNIEDKTHAQQVTIRIILTKMN